MFDDDNEPQKKKAPLKKLDNFSVDELYEYIAEMQAEIVRAEAEIKKKKAASDAASSFFK
jgi:uncharacterized small protein (DUF1192 family)